MAITYDQASNKITVTGYSEATPADFDDLYTEDTGATNGRELLGGAIDADPDTFSLDNQPKPADDLAVPLKVSCTARGGATCDISGTDAWDNAVSETGIDISSGSAATTQRFKTVDASGISVNGLQNGDDFDVYQDRWGVISKRGTIYVIGCFLRIGDDSTTTWFADTKKVIVADAAQFQTGHLQSFITVETNATFRLGTLVSESEKQTRDGCHLVYTSQPSSWWDIRFVYGSGGTIHLYSCTAQGKVTGSVGTVTLYKPDRIWDFAGSSVGIERAGAGQDLNRLTLDKCNTFVDNSSSINDLILSQGSISIDRYASADVYVENSEVKHSVIVDSWDASRDVYLTNVIATPSWIMGLDATTTSKVYRRYTFDLEARDKNNNAISGASVKLTKTGESDINLTTDVNGQITQQTLKYGYYDQANGNTIQNASDWTLTIQKAGYQTYTKQFTLDEKIDWRVALLAPVAKALTSRAEREVSFTAPKREMAFTASGREL